MNERIITNIADLTGTITTSLIYSHTSGEKKYYLIYIDSQRLSGVADSIPVLVPDHLLGLLPKKGEKVRVVGRFLSHNAENGRLLLRLYVDEVILVEEEIVGTDHNEIFLHGFICKEPVVRITPMGRRIAEVLLAVNRSNYKSDYIPCIAWGV